MPRHVSDASDATQNDQHPDEPQHKGRTYPTLHSAFHLNELHVKIIEVFSHIMTLPTV